MPQRAGRAWSDLERLRVRATHAPPVQVVSEAVREAVGGVVSEVVTVRRQRVGRRGQRAA